MFRVTLALAPTPALRTGRFIPLKVHQNHRDPKVIAFVRQYKDRSLLVIANKDLNTRQKVTIEVPGLSADQKLANLAPSYGKAAEFTISAGQLRVDQLGPGKFYLFDVDLPPMQYGT